MTKKIKKRKKNLCINCGNILIKDKIISKGVEFFCRECGDRFYEFELMKNNYQLRIFKIKK